MRGIGVFAEKQKNHESTPPPTMRGHNHSVRELVSLGMSFYFLRVLQAAFAKIKKMMIRAWRLLWRGVDRIERVILLRLPRKIARKLYSLRPKRRKYPVVDRILLGIIAGVLVFSIFGDIFITSRKVSAGVLSPAASQLLGASYAGYEPLLTFDRQKQAYLYNQGYQAASEAVSQGGIAKFSAELPQDSQKGITVTDPATATSVKFVPLFSMGEPSQIQNRIVYPIKDGAIQKVYTLRSASIKEDIIVNSYQSDKLTFRYQLKLPSGTEARLESNGSIGFYGVSAALLGNVTTASESDALLLDTARKNGEKRTLLFSIPAPFVKETGRQKSAVKSKYSLKGDILTVSAEGLQKARYPITIDPTIYIETARKLMRGNNESNIDFDIDNELIQKSQTTGARINSWSSTSNLTSAVWGQGTAVAGGYIYSVGGVGSSTTTTTTYNTAGSSTYNVPAGVTSVTVKTWGGGGGGGAGGNGGGNGGGGGYAKAVLAVTPSESLTIEVGSGGAKSVANGAGANGGGYSAVKRGATFLVQAGGGGGGGGARGSGTGGNAGAAGAGNVANGTVSVAGSNGSGASSGGGGGRGTDVGSSAGAAGGSGAAGTAGAANAGGKGSAPSTSCATAATGTGGAGGTGVGGIGGAYATSCASGGGGGGGAYGGGGGGSVATNNRGAGGGGGGSSLTTGVSKVETAGSGTTPGNSGDTERGGLADGGTGAATTGAATNGENGIVLVSYVTPGSVSNAVYWAQFNSATNAIDSPNPGNGTCAGWCTNSAYNLPTALTGLSVVAYNGFLYAIGGADSGGTPQTSVYIAKLGANGEPQLWHPSGGTPTYWFSDTALSNARSQFAAVAYNNRLYILGGLTTASTVLSTNTVQYADINPMGTLTTWTATGMQALSTARYGITAHIYNDTLYVLGGNAALGGSPVSTVEYSRLETNGTMNAWVTASSIILGGRMTGGGSFSTVYGGYMYINGGCEGVNASGYCTSISDDVQLASINADGSLSEWNQILGLSNDRFGHTMIGWQGGLYRLGGCRAQDSGTGQCTNAAVDVDYGVINPDGEASTVAQSDASGAGLCTGGDPNSCDVPASAVGNMLNASIIANGYLYIMGGCTNNACTSYSDGITYQSIGSDGTLRKPASCDGTYIDSYCESAVALPSARAATATTVFNNRIYLVGGFPSITNISYVSLEADGSLGTWQNTDTTSVGAVDVSYAFAYARANPSAAGSNPGNLYIFGGCTTTAGIGCSGYTDDVYKCIINTSGVPSGCSTSGQLQIGTVAGASGAGLAAFAGAVYANYIYLMGGLAPGATDLVTVYYAKFDDSNNVVDADGETVTDNIWTRTTNDILVGRRRGAGFGYNGFLYVTGGYDGTDALADIEFAKIDVSSGDIGVWASSSVSINKRWGLTVPVSNSYAYVIGGCVAGGAPSSCTSRTNTIQTFQIYNNDSGALKNISSFSDDTFATAGTENRWGASSAILNGKLYVAGGCVSATDCTDATSDVEYATISTADGSVGTWSVASNGLPADRAWGQLEVLSGRLYYLGGQDDASDEKSEVYYVGSFDGSGNITSPWSTASGGVGDTASQAPQDRTKFGAAVWNGRIYVVAGLNDSAISTSTVYISPLPDSGTGDLAVDGWTSDADVPDVARFGGSVIAYANNLYLFGGNDGTNYLNDGQFTQINSDGSVDAWTFTTSTPGYISQADGFAANGYIYLVGGRSATTSCRPQILIAPISANTTIATGNNPTGVGEWSQTNVRYAGGRYGAGVAYEKGKMYITGGGCTSPQAGSYSTGTITQAGVTVTGAGTNWRDDHIGTTITYADASTAIVTSVDSATQLTVSATKTIASAQSYALAAPRHSYAVVKSQPQIAKYSRMIDADIDVFPTKWLMNGLDNSTGARWYMRYRSMTDNDGDPIDCVTAMTTWGQETNFGAVTLGNPESYTARDGSGVNTNCARYFYFTVSIDSSQAFGYPEDVSRGPTIADLSLFFTADPSKRLIHGKTFTGGEQQPLDTPF